MRNLAFVKYIEPVYPVYRINIYMTRDAISMRGGAQQWDVTLTVNK